MGETFYGSADYSQSASLSKTGKAKEFLKRNFTRKGVEREWTNANREKIENMQAVIDQLSDKDKAKAAKKLERKIFTGTNRMLVRNYLGLGGTLLAVYGGIRYGVDPEFRKGTNKIIQISVDKVSHPRQTFQEISTAIRDALETVSDDMKRFARDVRDSAEIRRRQMRQRVDELTEQIRERSSQLQDRARTRSKTTVDA